MKTLILIVAILLSILAVGSGLSLLNGQEQKEVRKPNPAKAEEDGPSIALSINCLKDAIVLRGKGLLIEASVSAGRGEDGVVKAELSKPGGGWGELVAIEVRNARGDAVAGLDPKLVAKGDASITLDGDRYGWLVWVIDPADLGKLAPGEYSVIAVLDMEKNAGAGWKGKTSSPPSSLTVKPNTANLSEDETRLSALTEIRIHSYLGRGTEALAACDRFLSAHPKDGLIMEERADTLARAGKFKEAIAAYDAAIANVPPQPESPLREPPFGLIEKRAMAAEAAAKSP